MKTIHKIINGDCRKMSMIDDNSVHLIVTSPPYWQLKDYGAKNQIGFNESYESYINSLNLVWLECNRVLHKGCRLCINIGDQFARSVYYGRYKVIPIHVEIIRFCEHIGLDYMGSIIWQKNTTINTTGGEKIMGSYPYPRNGVLKIDYEFILLFKKQGDAPKPTCEQRKLSEISKDEWTKYFASHWVISGIKQDGHIAMFPNEVPYRLIKMFSFVGETVLDPFMGSGTTALTARILNRNSIGYEINPEFISTYKSKLNVMRGNLRGDQYIIKFDRSVNNYTEELFNLPYIFTDPNKLDKKIDVKKLQFGSVIDKNGGYKKEYVNIKRIISPNVFELSNGLVVRLIGVKNIVSRCKEVIQKITDKFLCKEVYMEYDKVKYDDENRLLCYLYLRDTTLINAYLLETGCVEVDTDMEFKYKNIFLNMKK